MTEKTLQERIDILEKEIKKIENIIAGKTFFLDLKYAKNITMIATFIKALIKENNLSKDRVMTLLPDNCPEGMKDWISYYFDIK